LNTNEIRGIKGLTGTVPISAVLTIGKKGPTGAPVEKDRFYIKDVQADDNDVRGEHPLFAKYNHADPKHRKYIQGNLMHAEIPKAWTHRLAAYRGPKGTNPPNRKPFCVGDGRQAVQFDESSQQFLEIDCPNDLCQFRQGAKPLCKPSATLIFRVRWHEGSSLPSLMMKFSTKSWYTIRYMLGVFEQVESAADGFGVEPNVFGLPFSLRLTEETNREKKSRFPVVVMQIETDLVEFFERQADRQSNARLAAPQDAPQLTTASDEAADYLDHEELSPNGND
jgi:hypothetical protein